METIQDYLNRAYSIMLVKDILPPHEGKVREWRVPFINFTW